MKVITWNINSFRKRYDHIVHLLEREQPDILLLQEVRNETLIPIESHYGYFQIDDSLLAGHAGVAIISKHPLKLEESYDNRVIVCSYEDYVFISVYIPNGFSQMSSLDIKLKFFDKLINTIKKYSHKNLIIGGDWNVCYKNTECSMENPFRLVEKNKLKEVEQLLKDSTSGPHYTWFSYANKPVKFSVSEISPGLGLDKIYCSYSLDHEQAKVLLYYRNLPTPSDHTPVVCKFYPLCL